MVKQVTVLFAVVIGTKNPKGLVIVDSFQIPIIRGASAYKGRRIGLAFMTTQKVALDSMVYEGQAQKCTVIKQSGDTTWIDASFYPIDKKVIGKESTPTAFDDSFCMLYYTEETQHKTIVVKDIPLVTSETEWK